MRHRSKKVTLGRNAGLRKALFRSLAESLILHDGIVTTRAKARALRSVVEPLVTKAKRGSAADTARIQSVLYTGRAVKRLTTEIAPRYKERPGGYTRITKLGVRASDGGDKVRIEFV